MKHIALSTVLSALVLASGDVASAQSDSPAQAAQSAARSSNEHARIESFEFAGGSVVDYIAVIRQHVPDANFVLMPGADRFIMPPMELRNITLEQAVRLINETSQVPVLGSRIGVMSIGDVFAVQVYIRDEESLDNPRRTFVWSLASIVSDDLEAADVLTGIETALDLIDDQNPPVQLRYHQATKLLIARGQQDQLAPIMEVLGQLGEARLHEQRALESLQTTALRPVMRMISEQNRTIESLTERLELLERTLQDR